MTHRYTTDQLEDLVPAALDPFLVLDAMDDNAPDPDMPKSPLVNPHVTTDKWVEVADLSVALRNPGVLTPEQRKAVVYRYGLLWPVADIHYDTGWTATEYRLLADEGIQAMLDYLNFGNIKREE